MNNQQKLEQAKQAATQAAIQYQKDHPDPPRTDPKNFYQYTDIPVSTKSVSPLVLPPKPTPVSQSTPPITNTPQPTTISSPEVSHSLGSKLSDVGKDVSGHLVKNAGIYGGVAAAGLGAYALTKYLKNRAAKKEEYADTPVDEPVENIPKIKKLPPTLKKRSVAKTITDVPLPKQSIKKVKTKKQATAFYNTDDIKNW